MGDNVASSNLNRFCQGLINEFDFKKFSFDPVIYLMYE